MLVCKLAGARFIPHFIRDRRRRRVCGIQMRPLPPDLAKGLQTKEKALFFSKGFKTWCGLLCDYRTTSCTEINNLKAKIDAFWAKIDPEGINLAQKWP